jgi:hypothetical protein
MGQAIQVVPRIRCAEHVTRLQGMTISRCLQVAGLAVVGAAVLCAAGAFAYASIPDAGGTIHGCYDKAIGQLRVIDTASSDPISGKCLSTETAITWSQTGPQGPKGDPGTPGTVFNNGSLTGSYLIEPTIDQLELSALRDVIAPHSADNSGRVTDRTQ